MGFTLKVNQLLDILSEKDVSTYGALCGAAVRLTAPWGYMLSFEQRTRTKLRFVLEARHRRRTGHTGLNPKRKRRQMNEF